MGPNQFGTCRFGRAGWCPGGEFRHPNPESIPNPEEKEFFVENLLVRIHFIIVKVRWTGLAPWEFEFPFPGSLTSTFLVNLPQALNLP